MQAQYVSNLGQRGDAGIGYAGLDVLVGGAGDAGGEEHGLLGAVLPDAGDADAVADGPLLLLEPFVVVGQGWHSTHARLKIIISQPGEPGLL